MRGDNIEESGDREPRVPSEWEMRVADGLEPLRIFGRRINSCCRMRGGSGSTRRGLSCWDIRPEAQLALCLAAHETEVKAAISLAGVVDLQRAYELHLSNDAVVEFLGGTPGDVPEHYREADPMKLAIHARQWLVHGNADGIVPPALSEDYVSAKGKAKEDARLVKIAGAGHFEVVDPLSGAWAKVGKVVVDVVGKV